MLLGFGSSTGKRIVLGCVDGLGVFEIEGCVSSVYEGGGQLGFGV